MSQISPTYQSKHFQIEKFWGEMLHWAETSNFGHNLHLILNSSHSGPFDCDLFALLWVREGCRKKNVFLMVLAIY